MFAIILYHGIDSGERWDRSMTPTDREYVLSRRLFEEHIAYLSTNAVTVASLRACRRLWTSENPSREAARTTSYSGGWSAVAPTCSVTVMRPVLPGGGGPQTLRYASMPGFARFGARVRPEHLPQSSCGG